MLSVATKVFRRIEFLQYLFALIFADTVVSFEDSWSLF